MFKKPVNPPAEQRQLAVVRILFSLSLLPKLTALHEEAHMLVTNT
jgi:hypothetical protein